MNRFHSIAFLPPIAFVAACSGPEEQNVAPAQNEAVAEKVFPSGTPGTLVSPGGNELGTLTASDESGGVAIRIEARGLQPGVHGLRVHSQGRCQGPNFDSAGAMADGPAADGNLPTVTVGSDGLLTQTVTIPGATIAGLRDTDGSAMVLYMNPQSATPNPSDRIACGVV